MLRPPFLVLLGVLLLASCAMHRLKQYGRHYQAYRDFASLQLVVDRLPAGADTALVKNILGEPIDFGFDYRYLIDSTGPNGCPVGAVFHIGEQGKIDQQWLDEICE
ncbi:MAG: hypothetical protein H6574_18720 [Lewinellaceae bacterium]|nr:hypothetical protein [Saprospiraceae bacterium]MCB9314799.1 hypothetical protein [Lewinellaceae bacterium]MCB9333107.1 hypothetical protein [Lewinellaceae bacterium]